MATEKPLIRVVDDDADLRESVVYLLEGEGWCVHAWPDGESFLREDSPSQLGVAILDVKMPGISGLELYAEMKRRGFAHPVIFLTAHGDVDMAVDVLRDGAYHFLQKPLNGSKLIKAVAEAVTTDMRKCSGLPDGEELLERINSLTSRETQIINCLREGLLNADIAERLNLSVRTVEVHRAAAYKKLGVKSVAGLSLLFANSHGT